MSTDSTTEPTQDVPLLERLSATLLPELRKYLDRHREAADVMIRAGGLDAGFPAAQRYSKLYDGLLSSLFHAAKIAMMREGTWVPVALAAVGSYGRGALSPHSDLDVRILCEGDVERAAPVAEALLYPLWDVGLNIGHQVVTPESVIELAREDLPTATSLLDWRFLAGEKDLSDSLIERAFQGVFGPGGIGPFIERLETSAVSRHERFGGSVFLLEPDVKNGEGGLRDFDIAGWAARARWRVDDLKDLMRVGLLVGREWTEIEAARSMLFRVRNLLHVEARRRADRLSFDQQETLAEALAYGSGGPAVEQFMSDYYRHARTMARVRETIVGRAAPPPKRPPRETVIGNGLKLTSGAVSIVNGDDLDDDPALALRVYDEAVRRDLPVYDFARHAVARATSSDEFCERLRASKEASELFVRLLCVVQQTRFRHGSPLRELHDVGLLVAMVPEFAPVVGRVHHDIYHVYTVDVHSVAAVDQLRALCRGDLANEHPLACRLAAELPRPTVAFLSALLHDIGKDKGGKDHAERGAVMSGKILERLGLAREETEEVQHHVRKHLRMYHVATRRDVDDPKTLEELCADVHGREGLRELYLLTIADVTTTSPHSMTSWKRRMLDELYVAAERYLTEGVASRDAALPERTKRRILELWGDSDEAFVGHFLDALPSRYLYANDPEVVVGHARFALACENEPASVAVLAKDEPYVELCVSAPDQSGFLSLVTAVFARARLKVVGAQIYSYLGRDGKPHVLDMFWVRSGQDSQLAIEAAPRLERELRRLIDEDIDVFEYATGHGTQSASLVRPRPPVATRVNVDNRAATAHTVIEVITRDQRDLLFRIACTLRECGLTIDLAKVNTEGERVADVFYVAEKDGGKITDQDRSADVRQRILDTIASMETGDGS